jgi:hypothetical protein
MLAPSETGRCDRYGDEGPKGDSKTLPYPTDLENRKALFQLSADRALRLM